MNLSTHAPSPRKGTIAAAIYEVVRDLGGATMKDIKKYYPTKPGVKQIDQRRIEANTGLAVERGYLISDHTQDVVKYRIAPIEYFRARKNKRHQQYLRRRKAKGLPVKTKRRTKKAAAKPKEVLIGQTRELPAKQAHPIGDSVLMILGSFTMGVILGAVLTLVMS